MPPYKSVEYVPKNHKSDEVYKTFRLNTESTEAQRDSHATQTLNLLKINTDLPEYDEDIAWLSACNSNESKKARPFLPQVIRSEPDSSSNVNEPFHIALENSS